MMTESPIFDQEQQVWFDLTADKPCSYCGKPSKGRNSGHQIFGLSDGSKAKIPADLPLCGEACFKMWIGSSVRMHAQCMLLKKYKYTHGTEKIFQDGIETALKNEGVEYLREHRLSEKDIVDFYLPRSEIAIECKIKGSFSEFVRQVQRYSKHATVRSVILASSSARIPEFPLTINSKPTKILRLFAL